MKRGKIIKMVATGTGARKSHYWWVALSWSWGFLLQASLQTSMLRKLHRLACAWEKKPASCRLSSCPCWSWYTGLMDASRGRDAHGAGRRGPRFPKAECCQWRYQAQRVTPGPLPLHTHTHTHTHTHIHTHLWHLTDAHLSSVISWK